MEFAKWIADNGIYHSLDKNGEVYWTQSFNGGERFTTEKLFEIFTNQQ